MGNALMQRRVDRLVGLMRSSKTDLQDVEAKESVERLPHSLGDSLSAFANGVGGTVILGLSETHGFCPAPGFDAKRTMASFGSLCAEGMEPPLRPEIEICDVDGKQVVVAEIAELPQYDKPCYVKAKGMRKGSYIRTGDGDRRLTDHEIDRLLEEHVQPTYDAEVVTEASVDDLDGTLLRGLLDRARKAHPHVLGVLSDEDVMRNLRIVGNADDGTLRPTLGGLLALGTFPQKYYPRLSVAFAAYPKADGADSGMAPAMASETIVGPIPTMVADTVEAVCRHAQGNAHGEAACGGTPDYPLVAVRAGITNALMHRDYSVQARGMQVQVSLSADRLEIVSPGGLYGTLTLEMLGRPGFSATRNQHLSLILEETPYPGGGVVAENHGTGYQRIIAELTEHLMPLPVVHSTAAYLSLTFERRRRAAGERAPRAPENVEQVILDLLKHASSASAQELAQLTGLSRGGVMNYVRRLVSEGVVEPLYQGRSPKQRYRVV